MSTTAIGDLVVNLGANTKPFEQGLDRSKTALGEFTEEAGGSSRGIRFLGTGMQELGEKLSGLDGTLGATVSGFGSMTSGAGEAVHGLHAMHQALGAATAAQQLLNSVSPLGWTAIAAGAAAAVVGYLAVASAGKAAAEAAEEQKKASEDVETALKSLTHEAEKLEHFELEHFRAELQKTGKTAAEQLAALKEFGQLQDKIDKAKASEKVKTDADSAARELAKKEIELKTSGLSAGEKFAATFAAEHPVTPLSGAITPEQGRVHQEQMHNLELAQQIGREMDARKEQQTAQADLIKSQDEARKDKETAQKELEHDAARAAEEATRETEKLQADASRDLAMALEKPLSPMQRLVQEADKLKDDYKNGYLSQDKYKSGIDALAKKGEELRPKDEKEKKQTEKNASVLEKGTAEAWKGIQDAIQAGKGSDSDAKATAENTKKIADWCDANNLLTAMAGASTDEADFNRGDS